MKTIIEVEDCDKGVLKDKRGNYYYCEGYYKELLINNKLMYVTVCKTMKDNKVYYISKFDEETDEALEITLIDN